MKIKSLNYSQNINFQSRNKNIRKADDIQRRARQVFPSISPSYIDEFYSSTRILNGTPTNMQARRIFKKIDKKLTVLREVAREHEKSDINKTSLKRKTPYILTLSSLKLLKVGNCEECAEAILAALAANGFYDSRKVYLCLKIQYVDKNTGEIKYHRIEPLDHAFVVTTLDKENPKEKDKIVIDSWLGFADSISGANSRYKRMYKKEQIDRILSFHRSMFRLDMAIETGKTIDFNDYELHTNFIFYPAVNQTKEDMKKLGIYSRMVYDDLILPLDNN